MTSVEQLVTQIIDDLSEGVSELVLTLVILAEQNTELPPTFAESAEPINKTATKLSDISRRLASTDYDKYPTIAQEIRSAADIVDKATNTLTTSINNIRGVERKKGWEGLREACSTLSGSTIRLLQIVYGAPMKRIHITTDRLIEDIEKLPTKGWTDKRMDEMIKPVTENSLRMEKYLKDRANATESPNEKQKLLKAADDVKRNAQQLVDAVNRGFNNPRDDDLTIPFKNLKDSVVSGRNLANSTAPPIPRSPTEKSLPRLPPYQRQPPKDQESPQIANNIRKFNIPTDKRIILPPEDEDAKYLQMLRDAIKNLRKTIDDRDPTGTSREVQQVAHNTKALADQFRKNNPSLPEHIQQQRKQAADDLDQLIRPLLDTSKTAVNDLNNNKNANALHDAASAIERAAARGAGGVPYIPSTGNRFGNDDWKDIAGNIDRARDAARRNDWEEFKNAADNVQKGIDQFRRFNTKKGSFVPDPTPYDGPSKELQDLWNKFLANRNNPAFLDNISKQMNDVWNKYNDATAAAAIDASYDVDKGLDQVLGAVEARDGPRLEQAEKKLRDYFNKFRDITENNKDPRVRAAGARAVSNLEPQIENYLKNARNGLKSNPSDVQNMRSRMGQTLNQFRVDVSPQQDSCLINENHGAGVLVAQANLRAALASGDKNAILNALKQLQQALNDYNAGLHPSSKQFSKGKNEYLARKAETLGDVRSSLQNVGPQTEPEEILRKIAPIEGLIHDYSNDLRSDQCDDIVKGAAIANNLVNAPVKGDALMSRTDDLVDLFIDVPTTGPESNIFTDRFGENSLGPISEAKKSAAELSNMGRTGSGGHLLGQSASSTALSDVMQGVVNSLRKKSEVTRNPLADGIVKDLQDLSAAARSGNKENMIRASREASERLKQLSRQLKDYANRISPKNNREKEAQDILIKCANGLQNYATHLKILTAVKAASIHETRDTDSSLSTLSTELGDIITSGMDTLVKAQESKLIV